MKKQRPPDNPYRTIKNWPEQDRPREKLFEKGAESLTDAELLAIILRTGNVSTGESALDHARMLLNRFRKKVSMVPLSLI
jgi:DNA repair protein RadC